ncbi:MAG: long-chain fatty acid--CoA ligase [Treponema sp.]|jgi:long-chain acyl-CoA synthetase|nr:long-chain fatty acid--CoA ligase [Treponema sp.]
MEQTLPLLLRSRTQELSEFAVQYVKDSKGHFRIKTYRQFYDEVRYAAAGLMDLGVRRGDMVGIVSDNRHEWLVSDFSILSIGAVDVPRGCDATIQELIHILGITECRVCFTENQKQVKKILTCKDDLPCLGILITYDPVDDETETEAASAGMTVHYYAGLIARGQKREVLKPGGVDSEIDKGKRDDLVTIIFTSGTTGEPKGVMLTHGTFLHQLPSFPAVFETKPGEIFLSVLPVWHVFERAMEYVIIYLKAGIAYSKPSAPILLADFQNIRPHWMVAVPRIWEAIMDGIYRRVKAQGKIRRAFFNFFVSFGRSYNYFRDLTFGLIPNYHGRIRAVDAAVGFFPWLFFMPVRGLAVLLVFNRIRENLGGRFRAGISGGGTLPGKADHFFNAVGIHLQEAYGLTETSPVISARRYRKSRRGTVGQLLIGTEARIVGDTGQTLPPGHNGIIYVRGAQVMKGYYKKPEDTAAILSPDGWLNTGDIGMISRDNELRITGRAKDTIVLRGGENVEPVPIEKKLQESEWIFQCMVVGQDQKYLAALIVPVQEAMMNFAEENNIPIVDYELLLAQPEINELIANDVAHLINPQTGFKPFERIYKFRLIPKSFEAGIELSAKQELRRHRINALYAREINALFK